MRAIVVDDEPKIRNGLCRLVEGLEEWTVAGSFEDNGHGISEGRAGGCNYHRY